MSLENNNHGSFTKNESMPFKMPSKSNLEGNRTKADEIIDFLINAEPQEQNEFLQYVRTSLNDSYQRKIDDLRNKLAFAEQKAMEFEKGR